MSLILLILIFTRPFISSLAFPYLNSVYSAFLIVLLVTFCIIERRSLEKIQDLKYPIILFCLTLIISVSFSSNRINSFKDIYKYVGGLSAFLAAASLTHENRMHVLKTIILAGSIVSLLALYQFLFGFQHLLNYIAKVKIDSAFVLDYIQRKRVFFPFITPNTLAGYLIMIIPLALINKNTRWSIILLSFALLFTKSLGAFLSIFLAMNIYFYLQGKSQRKNFIFLFGMLVIIVLAFITRSATQKEHLQPIFSTMTRLSYWGETLEIIKRNPLSGIGIGNFDIAQSRFAHNSYLQICAEMGIPGLAGLIWIIFNVFKVGVRELRVQGDQKYIAVGLLAASSAFIIHNFIDFSFFLPEVSLIWWIILGSIASFRKPFAVNRYS